MENKIRNSYNFQTHQSNKIPRNFINLSITIH